MNSLKFTHDTLPQRVVLDTGRVVERVRAEAAQLGIRRPMLISTEGTHEVADSLSAVLSPTEHWRKTVQHVPRAVADEATSAARDSGADGVISIGGGSATGLAKEASQPLPRVPGQLKPESPALVPATTNDGR